MSGKFIGRFKVKDLAESPKNTEKIIDLQKNPKKSSGKIVHENPKKSRSASPKKSSEKILGRFKVKDLAESPKNTEKIIDLQEDPKKSSGKMLGRFHVKSLKYKKSINNETFLERIKYIDEFLYQKFPFEYNP